MVASASLDTYFLLTLQGLSDILAMADWPQLFQFGQQVQGRLQQLQHDLADKIYEAQAGGGLVRVTVDGKGAVRSLDLDPAVLEGRDTDLLADLILGAIAEGQRRAAEALQQEVRRMGPLSLNPPL